LNFDASTNYKQWRLLCFTTSRCPNCSVLPMCCTNVEPIAGRASPLHAAAEASCDRARYFRLQNGCYIFVVLSHARVRLSDRWNLGLSVVSPSVRLSHDGIDSKPITIGSCDFSPSVVILYQVSYPGSQGTPVGVYLTNTFSSTAHVNHLLTISN